jgi:8-oxo-dGTP pyrophosphatase MutT (NUDIX family)
MLDIFINKIEKYRKLKEALKKAKGEMVEFCNEQNILIKGKRAEIDVCEEKLSKGYGMAVVYIDQLNNQVTDLNSNYLTETTKRGKEILKLQKSIEELEKSDANIKELSKYDTFFTKAAFSDYIIMMSDMHKASKITDDELRKLNEDLLKFKNLILDGKDYKVKDNRKHYADMILIDSDNNNVLLAKRNPNEEFEPNKYALVGGSVEPAENYLKAAIRECDEEIGIKLCPTCVFPAGCYEDSQVVIHYFCARVDFSELVTVLEGRELVQLTWRSLEEILKSDDLILNLRQNFENQVIRIPDVIFKVKKPLPPDDTVIMGAL